jgi:hypothetical protein
VAVGDASQKIQREKLACSSSAKLISYMVISQGNIFTYVMFLNSMLHQLFNDLSGNK